MLINKITRKEIEKIDKKNTAIILGIAPIEQHGIHLPIGTDNYLTDMWINDSAKQLKEKHNYNILTTPIIPIGCSDLGGFYGDIHISQKLLYKLVFSILSQIVRWDIKNIIIISAHADPKHQIAIEEACVDINKKYGEIAFSPMGAIFSNEKVGLTLNQTPEVSNLLKKYGSDFHAGWIETSLMLYYNKELVKQNYKEVTDVIINERDMISPKKVKKSMEVLGHIGYPKNSTTELGEDLHKEMITEIVKSIVNFVERKDYSKYKHHFLFKIPFLRVKKFRRL